jgi:two-component system chemotaxis sensor kinase CheA
MTQPLDLDPDELTRFLDETDRELRLLETAVLALEQQPSPDFVRGMVRSLQTLKAMAADISHSPMETVADALEDLLDRRLASGQPLTPATIGAFLAGVEALRRYRQEVGDGRPAEVALAPLLARIEKLANAPNASARSSPGASPTGRERRVIDLGPEARGADDAEKLRIAAQKIDRLTRTIRLDHDRLDEIAGLAEALAAEQQEVDALAAGLADPAGTELRDTLQRLGVSITRLREAALRARRLPLDSVFSRIPRAVADLAHRTGKAIDVTIEGQDLEIDRSIVETIGDPLLHLVRNAVEHGIEAPSERAAIGKPFAGQVRVSAVLDGADLVIEVEDDGRGFDLALLRRKASGRGLAPADAASLDVAALLATRGASTADSVAETPGRGGGLAIARAAVEALPGTLTVQSEPGAGTRVTLRLPGHRPAEAGPDTAANR